MSTGKAKGRGRITPSPPMRFEDWIRQHMTSDRLQKVEATLRENDLYPPSGLFDFGKFGLIEPVYRIHHSSYKALATLDSMVTTCQEQLLYLFFGEMDEDKPLKTRLLKRLRGGEESTLRYYFMEVETATKEIRKWKGEPLDIRNDSMKLLGATMFWYVTLLSCMEVCKKALADDKWEPGAFLTWDEATAQYVAYEFSNTSQVGVNQWWPPSKAATEWFKKFKSGK